LKITTFDFGNKTGWAEFDGGSIESGTENFTPHRGESAGMRWRKFKSWLIEFLKSSNPDVVIFEQPVARASGAAREVMYGMTTRCQEYCDFLGIDYKPVNPVTLKRFATGKGNANKEAMLAAAAEKRREFYTARAEKMGWDKYRAYMALEALPEIASHDEADAILVLLWGLEEYKYAEGVL
jgi:hypothetical protein